MASSSLLMQQMQSLMQSFVSGAYALPLASGGVALICALLFTPLAIRLAPRLGWVAQPRANRWHERPTALMGGIVLYAAVAVSVAAFADGSFLWIICGGATFLFGLGLTDDLKELKPSTKLIAQVGPTLLLLYGGYAFGEGGPFWLTVPLTFLWVIGITNAVNLLDNMDGLTAGIVAIAAIVLAVFGMLEGDVAGAELMLALAGASLGFLVFNFNPAHIFMGDCGSMFLGYTIAAFALKVQGQIAGRSGLVVYLISAAVLAVPIFDTTLVAFQRALAGRNIACGGRDHTSHRLVFLGLSDRDAVLTLYGISLAFGALALIFYVAEVELFLALAAFLLVGLGVFGVQLSRVQVYGGPASGKQRSRVQQAAAFAKEMAGWHWKSVVAFMVDLVLVAAAFIVAHYLRFADGLSSRREIILISSLPAVIGVKMMVFYFGGLYQGLWRRAGTPEFVRVARASVIASLAAYGVLIPFYGLDSLSEAAFFIDGMIVVLAVTGVRFGFRGLRQYLSAQRDGGKSVLLYGAGDAGSLTLRRLRQNTEVQFHPVGFIDDDPLKKGRMAQGLQVLGGFEDLTRVCHEYAVEEVLITAFGMTHARKQEILHRCRKIPVGCRIFDVSLRPLPSGDGEHSPVSPVASVHEAQQ